MPCLDGQAQYRADSTAVQRLKGSSKVKAMEQQLLDCQQQVAFKVVEVEQLKAHLGHVLLEKAMGEDRLAQDKHHLPNRNEQLSAQLRLADARILLQSKQLDSVKASARHSIQSAEQTCRKLASKCQEQMAHSQSLKHMLRQWEQKCRAQAVALDDQLLKMKAAKSNEGMARQQFIKLRDRAEQTENQLNQELGVSKQQSEGSEAESKQLRLQLKALHLTPLLQQVVEQSTLSSTSTAVVQMPPPSVHNAPLSTPESCTPGELPLPHMLDRSSAAVEHASPQMPDPGSLCTWCARSQAQSV
jgi:hypothetical protein